MRQSQRGPRPHVLEEKRAEAWTKSWVDRRTAWRAAAAAGEPRRAPAFKWPTYEGSALNHLLLPPLREMTRSHCAYCDGFPVDVLSRQTIDHFRPKSNERFEALVVEWTNLFYACSACQTYKGEGFDDELLKPDEAGFRFAKFFVYQPDTGELAPHPAASDADKRRARVTIQLFGLNDEGRPTDRKRWFERFTRAPEELDVVPYRFLFGEE